MEPLLQIKHVSKYYPSKAGVLSGKRKPVKAVDDVSFSVYPGETMGIVGESGCGKTTLGKTILHLFPATGGRGDLPGEGHSEAKGKGASGVQKACADRISGSIHLPKSEKYDRKDHRGTAGGTENGGEG